MGLHDFYDPQLEVDITRKPAELEQEEIARIQNSAVLIMFTMSVPRRLGEDASEGDLANDKRRCKRILHVLRAAMKQWAKVEEPKWRKPTAGDEKAGVSLDWDTWYAEQDTYLQNRRIYIATYGLARGEKSWANSAVSRLTNEISWLKYAMR